MRLLADVDRPRLRLGAPPAAFPARLPEAIRRYRQILPQAEFTLKELTSHEQAEALRDGRIDVGISRVRIENPSIHREVLVEEPLIAALPWDHPLAAEEDVSLEALIAGRLALYPNDSRPGFGDHILSLLQDRGLTPSDTLEVRDLQTALVLVAAGEALCIAPDGAGLFAHPGIVFRPIREPVFAPLILCWRLGDVSPAVTAFLRAVDETLRRPA